MHVVAACLPGDVAVAAMTRLLKAGAPPDVLVAVGGPEGGDGGGVGSGLIRRHVTALHLAIECSEPSAAFLLRSGAAAAPFGADPSPLHVACSVGASGGLVEALLASPRGRKEANVHAGRVEAEVSRRSAGGEERWWRRRRRHH